MLIMLVPRLCFWLRKKEIKAADAVKSISQFQNYESLLVAIIETIPSILKILSI